MLILTHEKLVLTAGQYYFIASYKTIVIESTKLLVLTRQ